MVAQIVGNYLVERGIVTRGQMLIIQKERKKVRARLGLVAISEGYMTQDEVNQIYAEMDEVSDRLFAEIAEERAYLTGGQIRMLAHKQNESFLCFAQALENQKLIDFESLNKVMHEFPIVNNEFQLDDLKSNDINRILPLFIPQEADEYVEAALCAVKFLEQKVDSNIYPVKAYLANALAATNGIFQFAKGEKEYAFALVAKDKEMTTLATCYMHERHDRIDEELLDIISEIVNKISSSYAAEISQDGVLVDLSPPQSYTEMKEVKADNMLVVELTVKYEIFYLLVCMSANIEII